MTIGKSKSSRGLALVMVVVMLIALFPVSASAEEDIYTMTIGQKQQMEVIVEPADATYPELNWDSDNWDVAEVDDNGVVTAIAPGTAIITATAVDSPSDDPIQVSFTIKVALPSDYVDPEEHIQEMEDEGVNFSLINSVYSYDGTNLKFNGTLMYVGEEDYPPVKLILAFYDRKRLVGSAVISDELVSGKGISVSADIGLRDPVVNGLNAVLYILDSDDMNLIPGYTLQKKELENITTGTASEVEGAGIYDLKVKRNAEEDPIADRILLAAASKDNGVISATEKTIDETDVDDFYSGANKVRMTVSEVEDGKAYTAFVLTKKDSFTAGSIAYIGQAQGENGTATFELYPDVIGNKEYYIYLSGNEKNGISEVREVASFKGYVPSEEPEDIGNYIKGFSIAKNATAQKTVAANVGFTLTLSDNADIDADKVNDFIGSIVWTSDNQDIVANSGISLKKDTNDKIDINIGSKIITGSIEFTPTNEGNVNITGTLTNGLTDSKKIVVNPAPKVTYNITYNLDGGSVYGSNPESYVAGEGVITLNTPYKDGYEFLGWTGGGYAEPTKEAVISMEQTGDLTFVAHWKIIEEQGEEQTVYSISYVLDGGMLITPNPTTYTSTTPTFSLASPVREGYTFLGWKGSTVMQPTIIVNVTMGTTGDLFFVATWQKNDSSEENESPSGGTINDDDQNDDGTQGGTNIDNKETPSGTSTPGKETPGGTNTPDKDTSSGTNTPDKETPSGTSTPDKETPGGTGTDSVNQPDDKATSDPIANPVKTVAVKKGLIIKDIKGTAKYKVTAVSKKKVEVSYLAPVSKKATEIVIPKTVTLENGTKATVNEISTKAFKNYKKLKGIVISEGITKIGANAFENCKQLKNITIKSTAIKTIGKNTFKGVPKKANAKVPGKQKKKLKSMMEKAGYKGKVGKL